MAEALLPGPITNLQDMQTALSLGFIDEKCQIQKVSTYLDANEELYRDGDLAELVCLDLKRPDSLLRAPTLLAAYLARTSPDFDPLSESLEPLGKELLKQVLERYLNEKASRGMSVNLSGH